MEEKEQLQIMILKKLMQLSEEVTQLRDDVNSINTKITWFIRILFAVIALVAAYYGYDFHVIV